MRIFIIIYVSVFIIGILNETRAETRANIINDFKRQMSVFAVFDADYHMRINNVGHVLNTRDTAVEYARKTKKYYEELMNVNQDRNDFENYMRHHMYFDYTDTGKPERDHRVAFANAYLAYITFWETISFRICGIYFSSAHFEEDGNGGDLIKDCNQLYPFMHWFFSIVYDQRISDFRQTSTKMTFGREFLKKLSGSDKPSCYVTNTADSMKKLDLSFILNETNFDLIPDPQTCNAGIIKWNEIPTRKTEKYGREFRSIFPSDEEKNTAFASNKELYDFLWNKVINVLGDEIMNIEHFFHWAITGQPLPASELDLKKRIPDHELSLKIWNEAPNLIEIRNLDASTNRRIVGLMDSKPKRRSNVSDILKNIMEVRAKYRLSKLSESSTEDISKYKLENKFGIITTDADIDYLLCYPNTKWED